MIKKFPVLYGIQGSTIVFKRALQQTLPRAKRIHLQLHTAIKILFNIILKCVLVICSGLSYFKQNLLSQFHLLINSLFNDIVSVENNIEENGKMLSN